MKKYCDFYFTTRHYKTIFPEGGTPIKMYAWYVRNKKGEVMQSSFDKDLDWGEGGLYDSKIQAELDAREAIEDHYR